MGAFAFEPPTDSSTSTAVLRYETDGRRLFDVRANPLLQGEVSQRISERARAQAGIAFVFALIGFVIGVLFCANIESIRQGLSRLTGTTLFDPTIYFLSKMPAELDAGEVTAVVVMALTLTLLATLYPSWRAAKLDPVEALRYG